MEYPEKFSRLRAPLGKKREGGEKGRMGSGIEVRVVDGRDGVVE
jgi:hypothetical protein